MSDVMTQIPQTNPGATYLAHRAEIDAAIAGVLSRGWYILGAEVEAFEREFAAFVGVEQVIGVGSGTDALSLALRACGIGPGDAVATVSHSAVATVAAIVATGAAPLLIDIDPATYRIDAQALADALDTTGGRRVKAVIPVHLYGHPADMRSILDIAGRYGLHVIEDCAQSHGARIEGKTTGGWGHLAAFSFYPTKNLGAFGDGGAVATNDSTLAERVRLLREYGWRQRYISDIHGTNSRLDEVQAAVLRVKLRYLEDGNARRRAIASQYDNALASTTLVGPAVGAGVEHVYHQYVVRSPERDRLRTALKQRGVGTLVHYPVPIHLQPAYQESARHGPLAHTEKAAAEVVSLPMFPELHDQDVAAVIGALHSATRS
jgi:dTDP-4-amino-4,6-dideoxygalactose transaminase